MTLTEKIEEMEQKLADRGHTVDAFCRFAGIARSTWQRWKADRNSPNIKTWDSIEASFREFMVKDAA